MQDMCRKESTMEETYMEMLTRRAKSAATEAAKLGTAEKNRGLLSVADELISQQELILAENEKDLAAAREKGIKQSLIDRLALSGKRIADMSEGLRRMLSVCALRREMRSFYAAEATQSTRIRRLCGR